jgi:parafibromin
MDIPTNLLGLSLELSAATSSQTNMKDDNANHSCLVGCVAHTSDGPPQPDSLDPEILSYFLVRKTINTQGSESASVSPLYSNSRARSLDKSPKPPDPPQPQMARRSQDSRRSKRKKRNSLGSSRSASSKYRSIKDWSAGVDTTTLSSFDPPVRNAIDPPRAPKPGFEWVWFPEGYWAEREIRGFMPPKDVMKPKWWNRSPDAQKSKSPSKSMSGDKSASGDKTPPPFIIPRIQIGSISVKSTTKTSRRTSENENQKNKNLWALNFIRSVQREDSQSTRQREGLYWRTKRNIEIRFRKRVRASST